MCNTCNYLKNNPGTPGTLVTLFFADNSRNPCVHNPRNSRNSDITLEIKVLTPVDNWAGISL